MKVMIVLAIIILSWTISHVVGEYNPTLGEILGMNIVQPFVLVFLLIILLSSYNGLRRIFNKEKIGKKVEKITEKEELNSPSDHSDLYLKKCISTSELIEYQITSKENAILWSSNCKLIQGKLHSIILYAGDIKKEVVFEVTKEPTSLKYRIKNSQSNMRSIIITTNGLIFNDVDDNIIYTATPETASDDGFGEVVDWLLFIDTLNPFSSASKIDYFILRDKNDEVLGKYYLSLKNIDLTIDTNNKFDRRIAAIFSILLDSALIGNLGR